jgi:hypothetical protein
MVKNTHKSKQSQKAIALLALSLKKTQLRDEPCPDENTIAAYCDGRLNEEEIKKFKSIILRCPDSYSLWMKMEQYRHQWEDQISPQVSASLWQKIYQWMIKPTHFNSSILAVASVIILSFVLKSALNTPQLMDSYKIIAYSNKGISFSDRLDQYEGVMKGVVINGIPLFSNAETESFKEGIKIAKNKINNTSEVDFSICMESVEDCTDLEQIYRYAGSWSLFMSASCQLDSVQLYLNQQLLFNNWYKQLQRYKPLTDKSTGLSTRLDNLKALLSNTDAKKSEVCSINNELLRFVQR